ncbi:S-layer homology domain-containing protein [Paenibacillus thailandensis]|uniref:S-layer homology domain-containing protein n=1 Tax=Paenibacillus thailandensis TaxID=393250 RepID=A0ABW5QWJ1_9BACL
MKTILLKGALSLALLLSVFYPIQAQSVEAAESQTLDMYFPADIEEHWAYDEMDNFVNADLLKGYVDAEGTVTLKPNNSITRAEFVAILVRALNLQTEQSGKTFADVEQGKWYSEPIRVASSLGIVNGVSDTKFGVNQMITRGEIATIVVRAFEASVSFEGETKAFTDVPDYYAKPFIEKASQAGIVRGATADSFKPFARATRAEAVVMLQRALDLERSDLPEDGVLTEIVKNAEQQELEAMADKNYDGMTELYKRYFTGYQLASNLFAIEEIKGIEESGFSFDIQKSSDAAYEVADKTNRFAVVLSSGGSYTVTMNDGTEQTVETESSDGTYLLKKTSESEWKIYAFYPDEELE